MTCTHHDYVDATIAGQRWSRSVCRKCGAVRGGDPPAPPKTWTPHTLKRDPAWQPIGRGDKDMLPGLPGVPHKAGPLPGSPETRALALADPRSGTYFDFATYERVEIAVVNGDLYELLRYSATLPAAAGSQIQAATNAAWWAFIKGEG